MLVPCSIDLNKLKSIRKANRRVVTRHLRIIEDLKNAAELARVDLLATFESVEEKKKLLNDLNQQILNAIDSEDIEDEILNTELTEPTIISQAIQTEAESCNDRQSASLVVDDNSVQTEENVTKTSINSQTDQIKDKFCKDRKSASDVIFDSSLENDKSIRKKKRFIDMNKLFIFLAFSAFGTTYAQNLPIPTIVTSPIVFGEDVTFQCSYNCPKTLSLLSMLWLRGQTKKGIIYGNSSTKDEKYTSTIYHEANQYQYLLTIHNVSIADFDKYSCEFDFQDASIAFTLNKNLSFIYFPDINDVIFNVTESELTIWIQRIYPQPNCTVIYNDKDISQLMKTENNKREETMYSTVIKINLSECCGDVNVSCILNSRTFILIDNIQQCSKVTECLTGKEPPVWYLLFIILVIISVIVAAVILYFQWNKRKQTDQQKNYTGIPLEERNV